MPTGKKDAGGSLAGPIEQIFMICIDQVGIERESVWYIFIIYTIKKIYFGLG